MAAADLILVSVPESLLARITNELASAELDWRGRTVLLFDSLCESSALAVLQNRGAAVASLNWSTHPERFYGEGNPAALKRVKSLTGKQHILVLQSKALYLQAERASREGFYPVFASTVQLFCESGLEKATAEKTAALLFSGSIRAWLRAGHRLLKTSAAAGAG